MEEGGTNERVPFPTPAPCHPLILAGAGHLGPSLPFRSSDLPPFSARTLSPLTLAEAGHLGPSLPSFRPIFLLLPLILAGTGHLGPSLPFRSSHLLPFPTPAPCHPLILAGAGHLGPSLPSFRPIFAIPTSLFWHGPARSVSALSFVRPSSIFRPHPLTPYFGRGRPFRSVSAFFSPHFSSYPLFWQGPAI